MTDPRQPCGDPVCYDPWSNAPDMPMCQGCGELFDRLSELKLCNDCEEKAIKQDDWQPLPEGPR